MPSPRITRGYYSRVPRWSTNYPSRFNWTLLRPLDVVPLAVVLLFVNAFSEWFTPLLIVAIAWLCVRLARRLLKRQRWCAEHGHHPYRPVPEVAEYRCWYCDLPLDGPGPTEAETAADTVAKAVPQSRWSDRR